MSWAIAEATLIEHLKAGVNRTRNLIARATEYHGGPTTTEYLLTADLAREFIEADFEIRVEFLNRRLVNGMTARRPSPKKLQPLKGKRTDIVLIYTEMIPVALIEVKIGVATLEGIRIDLDKITDTIQRLNSTYASKVVGAVVFQVHVGTTRKRKSKKDLLAQIKCKEALIKSNLLAYAQANSAFSFRMVPLQGVDAGVVHFR